MVYLQLLACPILLFGFVYGYARLIIWLGDKYAERLDYEESLRIIEDYVDNKKNDGWIVFKSPKNWNPGNKSVVIDYGRHPYEEM